MKIFQISTPISTTKLMKKSSPRVTLAQKVFSIPAKNQPAPKQPTRAIFFTISKLQRHHFALTHILFILQKLRENCTRPNSLHLKEKKPSHPHQLRVYLRAFPFTGKGRKGPPFASKLALAIMQPRLQRQPASHTRVRFRASSKVASPTSLRTFTVDFRFKFNATPYMPALSCKTTRPARASHPRAYL